MAALTLHTLHTHISHTYGSARMCECVANGIRANGAVDSVDMQLTSTPPRAMSGVECVASVSSVKERVWCERAYANAGCEHECTSWPRDLWV